MKFIAGKIADKVNEFYSSGVVVVSNFLEPSEVVEVKGVLKNIPFVLYGGFEKAERKVIFIGVDDDFENFNKYISVIRLLSNAELSHRNVLGSVLGLGLKREMIGDILIDGNLCDIIVSKSVTEFLLSNLKYVGREKVSVKEVSLDELIKLKENFKEIYVSVSSLRIDSIISAGFGISREKSADAVKGELVKVNFMLVKSPAKAVCLGDVISVRGKGRLEIAEVGGVTKSGRQKVLILKKN